MAIPGGRWRFVNPGDHLAAGILARMTHLVWDWNGTLLDDLALTVEATNASLAAIGGPVITAEEHRRVFRRPLTDYYSYVLGRKLGSHEFGHIDEVFNRTCRSGLPSCSLAVDALAAMESWSGTQSLLSMWSHTELVPELRRRGLTRWLSRVDGCRGDTLGDLKAIHLTGHLAALDVPGGDCVLVGDSVDDANAATAVGARCVLYAGGITDVGVLRTTGYPVATTLVEAVALATTI